MDNYIFTKKYDTNIYIDYKDLTAHDKDINYMILLRNINNWIISLDHSLQINALNELRRLLRFNLGKFEFLFSNIYKTVAILINSINDEVSKTALILINEMFSNDKYNEWMEVKSWVTTLIPPVADKAVTVQTHIFKDLALEAFKNLSNNIFVNEAHQVLLDYIEDNLEKKNINLIIDLAFNTLDSLFINNDEEQFKQILDWGEILKSLYELYNHENQFLKSRIESLLLITEQKVGEKILCDIMEENVPTDVYNSLLEIILKSKKV